MLLFNQIEILNSQLLLKSDNIVIGIYFDIFFCVNRFSYVDKFRRILFIYEDHNCFQSHI